MLTALQRRVAALVASLPEAQGFALAGGAALVARHEVERTTRDLDYFTESTEAVKQLLPALEHALSRSGYEVNRKQVADTFARLHVSDGTDFTEIDLAVDARIRPSEPGPLGPTLALEELAADKLLALFDRAQPRDFVDVAALEERFGFARLCALASEKDAGFSRRVLREMLGGFVRFRPEHFGLDEAAYRRLADRVRAWATELAPDPRSPRQPPEPPGRSL